MVDIWLTINFAGIEDFHIYI